MKGNDLGLTAYIYRCGHDASNGGISRWDGPDCIVVFGTEKAPLEGYIKRGEYAYPEVELRRNQFGDVYAVAPPTPLQQGSTGHPMMGGNYIATSDSRFSEATGIYGAVPLHDRYETLEQYRSLGI